MCVCVCVCVCVRACVRACVCACVLVPCFVVWFLVPVFLRKRELAASLKLCYAVCVLCHFLAVPWVDLQSVAYLFPCELSASRHVHNRLADKSQAIQSLISFL